MRKELRHFLLFKQGPFFFQRTGKATRDSHSASNKSSTPVLGTKQPEWRQEKRNKVLSCFFQHLCSSSAWDSVVSISAGCYTSIPTSTQAFFILGVSPHFTTIYLHPLLSHVLSQLWGHLQYCSHIPKRYLPVYSTPKATIAGWPEVFWHLTKLTLKWKNQALNPDPLIS